MPEDKIREWIEKKLEEGVEEERIRKSLRETGHDPSLIDEVKAPFEGEEPEENPFSSGENEEKSGQEERNRETGKENLDLREEKGSQDFSQQEEEGSDSATLYGRLEPLKKKAPSKTSFSWKLLIPVLLVLGLAAAWAVNPLEAMEINSESKTRGCPDVGVRINSLEAVEGKTVAEVTVSRGSAEVTLEVLESGNVIGSSTANFEGERRMEVDAVGENVRFRPVNCMRYLDRETY